MGVYHRRAREWSGKVGGQVGGTPFSQFRQSVTDELADEALSTAPQSASKMHGPAGLHAWWAQEKEGREMTALKA